MTKVFVRMEEDVSPTVVNLTDTVVTVVLNSTESDAKDLTMIMTSYFHNSPATATSGWTQ